MRSGILILSAITITASCCCCSKYAQIEDSVIVGQNVQGKCIIMISLVIAPISVGAIVVVVVVVASTKEGVHPFNIL